MLLSNQQCVTDLVSVAAVLTNRKCMTLSFVQQLDGDAHTLGRGHPGPLPKGTSGGLQFGAEFASDLCSCDLSAYDTAEKLQILHKRLPARFV